MKRNWNELDAIARRNETMIQLGLAEATPWPEHVRDSIHPYVMTLLFLDQLVSPLA
jgi:hypothetical protein